MCEVYLARFRRNRADALSGVRDVIPGPRLRLRGIPLDIVNGSGADGEGGCSSLPPLEGISGENPCSMSVSIG
jgi:hypothetical protein